MTCANLTSFFFSRTRCRRNWLFTRRTLTSLMPSWTCCSRKGKRRRWHWKTEMERRITSIPKYPPFSPPPTQSRPLCWKYCHGPTYILLPVRSSFFFQNRLDSCGFFLWASVGIVYESSIWYLIFLIFIKWNPLLKSKIFWWLVTEELRCLVPEITFTLTFLKRSMCLFLRTHLF